MAESAAHRIAHRAGLLKDFLEHVMRVIALLNISVGKFDFAELVITALARDGADLEFVALDCHDIEVVEVNRIAGIGDDRADVACEKIFILPDAEDERTAAPGADDKI